MLSVAEEIPHLYVVAEGLTETDKILVEGLRKVHDGDVISLRFPSLAEMMSDPDVPAG
ncbi:MAG TPA: hypothetical protein VFG22_04795 [Polyangiales bacterium]|jgi:membrane fusion protein (multidrug efflux system)|nr:hypothetical protein [Polyangiales bacterium]